MDDSNKTKKFIEKAEKVWGKGVFDYKDVIYVKNNIPVKLWYNGVMVEQTPKHHLSHHLPLSLSEKKKHDNKELIEKFNKVHNSKYTYGEFEYKNAKEKNIPAYCSVLDKDGKPHGLWYVSATNHLSGCGCPKCKSITLSAYFASNTDEFISKAKKNHGDKYDYSKVQYKNNYDNIIIVCPEHGEFFQSAHNHLQGKGCPICRESHLENTIRLYLNENKIKFESQKRFDWLGKQSLDFYLPDYKLAIECQGEQHYKNGHFTESLDVIQNRDEKKLKLCHDNGIEILYFAEEKYSKNIITNKNELLKAIDNKINPDTKNIKRIIDFLNSEDIKFNYCINKIEHENSYITIEERFVLTECDTDIIYVNSYDYRKIDENGIGINSNFFVNYTKKENENGKNIIWIKDYEMLEETNGYFRKWEVIKSYIKYSAGKTKHNFYARNCEIHEVPNNELKEFLNKNCFYGYRPAKVNLGLYLKKDVGEFKKGELLMVYTFGNNFYGGAKQLEDGAIEVIRVSSLLDSHINGGVTKLLSYFIKNYKKIIIGHKTIVPKKLIFYVDADHNNGNSLFGNNFKMDRWTSGFVNVNSLTCKSEMRKPFKNDEMNKLIKLNKYYVSPTNGVMTFIKNI